MRSMVLLIDTNVLLNYITNRKDDCLQESIEVITRCPMSPTSIGGGKLC